VLVLNACPGPSTERIFASASHPSLRWRLKVVLNIFRVPLIALVAAVGILTSAGCSGPVEAIRPAVTGEPTEPDLAPASDASVIPEWNLIAERTILTDGRTPVPASALYFSFVSLAMYDAVVTIEGGYEQYVKRDRNFGTASAQAAAATAASVILRHYFPESAEQLSSDFRRTMSGVPRDRAYSNGVRAGIAAAAALLVRRLGDGREDTERTPETPLEPGVWRPTAPDDHPFTVPWLGFVRPLVLDSATQFGTPDPNALTSDAYARDFDEVKRLGGADGSGRTAAQTENALFFSGNAVVQYQAGMRDLVVREELDIVESARAFAMLTTSTADALIACWRAKSDHPTWRPITAIQQAATDGNPLTEEDPGWTPFGATPSYPEFASGHACLTGAASGVFGHLFGADSMDLTLTTARPGFPHSLERHYDSATALDRDAMDARVWLGIHFRSSMGFANQLGHQTADWAAAHYFRPAPEETPPTDTA
jgi:hypothetical protein